MVAPALIGGALYAGGEAIDQIGKRNAAAKQSAANDQYNLAQALWSAQERARQEQFRQQADKARMETLNYVSADSQKQRQAAEETRLGGYLNSTAKADDYYGLSGQQGADPVFSQDLARKLAEVTAKTRDRIKNMATTSSYTGSFGGLGTDNPIAFQKSGAGIDLANDMRRGSLAAYQRWANIQPQQIAYQSGFIPSTAKAVGAAMLGAGAQQFGAGLAGGTTPLPTGSYFADPGVFSGAGYQSFMRR